MSVIGLRVQITSILKFVCSKCFIWLLQSHTNFRNYLLKSPFPFSHFNFFTFFCSKLKQSQRRFSRISPFFFSLTVNPFHQSSTRPVTSTAVFQWCFSVGFPGPHFFPLSLSFQCLSKKRFPDINNGKWSMHVTCRLAERKGSQVQASRLTASGFVTPLALEPLIDVAVPQVMCASLEFSLYDTEDASIKGYFLAFCNYKK